MGDVAVDGRARAVVRLVACVGLCFAAAAVGGLATRQSVGTWYQTLAKPSWAPPDWVFGPVWTALYLMMAVAAWAVWQRAGLRGARVALALFVVQLALNAAWSWVFFGWRLPGAALVELAVLWCAILGTVVAFWRIAAPAGWLMLPYLAWVTFAGALNLALWRMNA